MRNAETTATSEKSQELPSDAPMEDESSDINLNNVESRDTTTAQPPGNEEEEGTNRVHQDDGKKTETKDLYTADDILGKLGNDEES